MWLGSVTAEEELNEDLVVGDTVLNIQQNPFAGRPAGFDRLGPLGTGQNSDNVFAFFEAAINAVRLPARFFEEILIFGNDHTEVIAVTAFVGFMRDITTDVS